MGAPVDVLAVMDDLPELLLLASSDPSHDRLRGIAPKVREARAAVAELIAAASDGNQMKTAGWDGLWFGPEKASRLRAAINRLGAAA